MTRSSFRLSVVLLLLIVGALNVAAWLGVIALSLSVNRALLDFGAIAYLLGLRHGFDADHIAAIDNVTRKLRNDRRPSASAGFFFALGHSTIVIMMTLALVTGVAMHRGRDFGFPSWGTMVGTVVSASFLTLVGTLNLVALVQLWGAFRARSDADDEREAIDRQIAALLSRRGIAARLFRFIYARINAGWNMYFVGLLFGLGFDTATEVALLGIAAGVTARHTFPFWSVMILPILFTAGMALIDTVDGIAMARMYDWAADDDDLKLRFNLVVTGVTVVAALLAGGIEWIQLLSRNISPDSAFTSRVSGLDFTGLGISIVVVILAVWIAAWWNFRRRPAQL
jgi:nickel/cobalt transporter (NiCoT) family protein